ncbi:hypothetical protein [Burkholderia ambifaria]|uniref:hypothetical protein n=1 Tax=Burkholderia ambifaria TaxID=152480 RepID=UPI00158BAD33|nr:hypothetical protein [Burkholderia ambifaria]
MMPVKAIWLNVNRLVTMRERDPKRKLLPVNISAIHDLNFRYVKIRELQVRRAVANHYARIECRPGKIRSKKRCDLNPLGDWLNSAAMRGNARGDDCADCASTKEGRTDLR